MAMVSGVRQPVLVTGATGFIGYRLVLRLIKLNYSVWCLARPSVRADDLRSTGAVVFTGDVKNPACVMQALNESKAGTVMHLAGAINAQRWGAGRADFMRINAGGVEAVAAACARSTNPPVLIVVSSLAAAGPSDSQRVELDISNPVSGYGQSKLAGERAAAAFAGAVPITIVRPPIVFGPGDRGVLQMFRSIARLGVHAVPGSGELRLSLVYVDDLVEGLLLAAERGERLQELESSPGSPGHGVYFMGGDDHPTLVQFGQAIAVALGKNPPFVVQLPRSIAWLIGLCGDASAQIRRHPGWISGDRMSEAFAGSWTCSSAKARIQLGWNAKASLAEGLAETASWYRQAGWL
ncbi:MAG: NAD(P)-dependent oxidoreductase [Phycisphaeraceae bacterium]|nr:NAD(P)-dependent oxidoreductase [Phycisphaeraceae bacterium]